MTDSKEIERDQVWKTRAGNKATVISTELPGLMPVLSWVHSAIAGYRLVHTRADGTVNSRHSVAHPDDLVERLV